MIEKPQIIETEARPTAVIHLTVNRADMQKVMGPAMAEVRSAVVSQGVGPSGPMFSRHFRMSPDVFDFEVGVPVHAPFVTSGRVYGSEIPATKVARTVYHGPYEGLGSAWSEFETSLRNAGHELAPDLWESYVSGPESSLDPASWRTELNRPLLNKAKRTQGENA